MPNWFIVRQTTKMVASRPALWLLVAVLLFAWRGLEAFMPLGLATDGLHRSVGHYELAFLGGLLTMLLTIEPLRRSEELLRRQGALARTLTEVFGLTTAALAVAAVVLIPASLLDLWQYADFSARRSVAAGWVATLHVAAMVAATALRPRGTGNGERGASAVRAVVVVSLLLVVPGLLVGESPVGRAALTMLDAGAILRTSFDFPISAAHWMVASLPILGWGALAVAFATPPKARPLAHALRHPR